MRIGHIGPVTLVHTRQKVHFTARYVLKNVQDIKILKPKVIV